MSRNTSEMTISEARSRGALIGSLLLLAASFVLLVLAPQLLSRFQSASETVPASGFLPIAAASGIALGGGAAMIAVMARLVRDIEVRPYACLAPVLAVFTGYVMWGLRARLPLESVSTEYVGVFALAVSVAGGSLIAQRSGGARAIGWGLALFAPLSLVALLWVSGDHGNLGNAVATWTPQVKMYLGLLGGTALAMGVLGEGSRVLARRSAGDRLVVPGSSQSYGYQGGHIEEERLFEPPLNRVEQEAPRYEPPPMRFDIKPTRAPRVNVWEFEDDDVSTLPKRGLPWATILSVLVFASASGAAFYYGVFLPKQQKEQAAVQALQQRQQELKAVQAQEDAQKRSQESAAAATRLEAILGGAPQGPAAAQTADPASAPAADHGVPARSAPKLAVPPQPAAPAAKRPEATRKAPAAKAAPPAQQPSAPAKAAREEANNDPIYGL